MMDNRKRKQPQEDNKWSDFIYSSPSSPSNNNTTNEQLLFNFESIFEQHHNDHHHNNISGPNSRRHSVAVGEMDFHSFDFMKHDMNIIQPSSWDDLHQLLANNTNDERPIHKRTMSLREDNPHYATLLSSSNHFLLGNNNNNSTNTNDTIVSMLNSNDLSTELLKLTSNEFNNTITPSAITNEINTMADWLLEQQQQEPVKKPQKRQRASTSTLSPVSPLGSSMSSSNNSPSPPITPMQQASLGFDHHHQQEDWNLKNNLVSNRMIQGETNAASLKPLIQNYLVQKQQENERSVLVLTSRVAQKSYGTEKRFLCPPPTTILKGANWWTASDKPLTETKTYHTPTLTSPKLTIHISGETINQTGVLEWQNGAHHIGRCVSKQLYINDADEKRKRVEVLAKIQLGNGLQLGTFPSKGIKVISKPSKKRQSIKNMELCIHHGTTISLFNRIRSQTVSTKYLGVSSDKNNNNGTCFVARTGSWDPFVIWIVDTSHTPDSIPRQQYSHHPNNPDFPPPPAIALQTPSTAQQPIPIHYNQPVVLQCVTTGLVSPVMIIRKVDKGSMVLGGNCVEDMSEKVGGECGDETLGDPVSQLHKVAFQIVQDPSFSQQNKKMTNVTYQIPQSCHPITYLACLNDVVGMHKTNYNRHLIPSCQLKPEGNATVWNDLMQGVEEENKKPRRRMSSISSTETKGRRGSLADRRGSTISDSNGLDGACWTEDVSDAAVWTIVGTDCASYTFWTPSKAPDQISFNMPFNNNTHSTSSITPFPVILQMTTKKVEISFTGENLTRDLCIWFGDIRAQTDYKSRDTVICKIPDMQDLLNSPTLITGDDGIQKKLPILLVRGDGIVYRTNQFYTL